MKPKVKLENITKSYQLYKKQSDKLLDAFSLKKKNKEDRTFTALQNISLEVFEGEAIGVIGINGSGKSTLSNILAGIVPPSSGTLTINGEASLIAINEGLNKQLTGLENIELKCIMLGLTKQEIEEITPQIIEFADIGEFINQPIKNYSSGMKSRLGFAISTFTNPDILIIDEALSVGDRVFYKKCIKKINEFKAAGKTIFFISHSMAQTKYISDRVLWLHYGEVREFGEKTEVLEKYNAFIKWLNDLTKKEKADYRKEMLQKQAQRAVKVREKRNKKPNLAVFFQLTALLTLTILSAFFMFIDRNPLAFVEKKLMSNPSESGLVEEDLAEEQPVDLNAPAVIQVAGADTFNDLDKQEKQETIEFATEVTVLEQARDMYKINYNDRPVYIDAGDAALVESEYTPAANNILDFEPLLPEGLSSSYLFFLAHLNMEYDSLKNQLNGLTNEGTDEKGNTFLEYGYDNVTFKFDEQMQADTLLVSNISEVSPLIEDMKQDAKVVSKDGKLIYLPIEGFNIYINLIDKTVTIVISERE